MWDLAGTSVRGGCNIYIWLMGQAKHPSKHFKMVVTRSLFRTKVRAAFELLPDEIIAEIFSHLQDKDLGVALSSSRRFFVQRDQIWRAACARRWPAWYALAKGSIVPWRREYEMLTMREKELFIVPSLSKIAKTQTVVNAHNRAVLTEWLAEVSSDGAHLASDGSICYCHKALLGEIPVSQSALC